MLLILVSIYRRWATLRLRQLAGWVEGWARDDMIAGVGGRGAEDGCYTSAVLLEEAELQGHDLTDVAADVFKCFDQLVRETINQLAALAGMPERVLDAYRRFREDLTVRNVVAGGFGQPYSKPTSTPQECPFSMMFVAVLTRP